MSVFVILSFLPAVDEVNITDVVGLFEEIEEKSIVVIVVVGVSLESILRYFLISMKKIEILLTK